MAGKNTKTAEGTVDEWAFIDPASMGPSNVDWATKPESIFKGKINSVEDAEKSVKFNVTQADGDYEGSRADCNIGKDLTKAANRHSLYAALRATGSDHTKAIAICKKVYPAKEVTLQAVANALVGKVGTIYYCPKQNAEDKYNTQMFVTPEAATLKAAEIAKAGPKKPLGGSSKPAGATATGAQTASDDLDLGSTPNGAEKSTPDAAALDL